MRKYDEIQWFYRILSKILQNESNGMRSKTFLITLFCLAVTRCCAANRPSPLRLYNGQAGSGVLEGSNFVPFNPLRGLRLELAILEKQEAQARMIAALERAAGNQRDTQSNDHTVQKNPEKIEQLKSKIQQLECERSDVPLLPLVRSFYIQKLRDDWQARWERGNAIRMADQILKNSRRAERSELAAAERHRSEGRL